MSDDHLMLSRDICRAVTDAFERAIVDRGAASATRRAAYLALLRLVDAGLVVDDGAPPPPPDGHDTAGGAAIPERPLRGRSRRGSESPSGRAP